jgi:hypothetical protein
VHVNHHVEALPPEPPGEPDIVEDPRHPARPFDDDDVVEVGIAGNHRRGIALDEIAERRVRKRPPQSPDQRRRQDHVADESQANEEHAHGSRFDGRLVQQHDGDVVLDRVDALALSALERGAVLDELDLRLAVRAGENLEQFRVNRHGVLVDSLQLSAVSHQLSGVKRCTARPPILSADS